jgi:hypothetical protein
MRISKYFISMLKEAPADAEIVSHQLMVRAGLIKHLAGGIYTWMPLGLRVLRKAEKHCARGNEPGRGRRAFHARHTACRTMAGETGDTH